VYRIVGGVGQSPGEARSVSTSQAAAARLKVSRHHRLGRRFGLAQNVGNAAGDKRAKTIPGTEDDLDESLLLAPMQFDDVVIGVIVLAKLGLNQFTADDLRLLEIYASIAAQAMANADVPSDSRPVRRLARQVISQRELPGDQSILGTLDTQACFRDRRAAGHCPVDNMRRPTRWLAGEPDLAVGAHAKRDLNTSMDDGRVGEVLRPRGAVGRQMDDPVLLALRAGSGRLTLPCCAGERCRARPMSAWARGGSATRSSGGQPVRGARLDRAQRRPTAVEIRAEPTGLAALTTAR
jgi:hypothetical protein